MSLERAARILNAHRFRGVGDWHIDPQFPGHLWSSAGVIAEAEAREVAEHLSRAERRAGEEH